MKKKIVIPTLSILLILTPIAILWGASEYMLFYSLSPNTQPRTEAHRLRALEEATSLKEKYPWMTDWLDSIQRDSTLLDTFITNSRGLKMHAYYMPAPKATPNTAIIIHGYGCHGQTMLHIGYMYHHDLGYNILLPDLHAHGLSEGESIQMGWLDRLDVEEWLPVADSIFGGSTEMVLHGISMGAATTMMTSGDALPPYVHAFVEDCGYTSAWDEFSSEMKKQFHLPAFPILHATSWLCQQRYGWTFQEASALDQVAKCTLPMLFIHGDEDTYVPTRMVYQLYEAKPEPKSMWIAPHSRHALSYQDHPNEYTRQVREFLTPREE